jgi:hypothetical protein
MSTEQKRAALAKAYPAGAIWAEKVKKMSDGQVHVIYMRLLNANQLSN